MDDSKMVFGEFNESDHKAEFRDKGNNPLSAGDFIVYATRDSCYAYLTYAKVTKIGVGGKIRVLPVVREWDGTWHLTKQVTLSHPERVQKVHWEEMDLKALELLDPIPF